MSENVMPEVLLNKVLGKVSDVLGNLVEAWLPALDWVVAKLHAGASVADVGCDYGASTVLMAQGFPSSTFLGTDLWCSQR
ncbi:MAG TPA: hypothetical protein VGR26_07530 [Acidimicrobiales bacterium]|nr:hypothetical protein [Acidimicrobiales bacterium]